VDSADARPATESSRFVTVGTGLLLLALFAVTTGIALLPFYSATAEGAHRSVSVIQASGPLRAVRAAHHWASALLLILGAAYLVYGLLSGAYRRPGHWVWVAAVGMVLLFFMFQLTGHLLPWDAHAVSSTAIEAGIAENVPVVGPIQGRLVRGGTDAVSPQTLRAWYLAHVVLFPAALVALAGLFLVQARRKGGGRIFWPAAGLLMAAVLVMGAAVPAPLGPPASPRDYTSYSSPPEWYVLPLHGLLRIAQSLSPSLTFLGTVGVPGLAVLWLLLLPWLDRRHAGEAPSPWVRGATALGVVGLLLLTGIRAGHMAPLFSAPEIASASPDSTAPTKDVTLDPKLVQTGRDLVVKHGCLACHKLGGQGAAVGPPLEGTGTRQPGVDWQLRHLKDPTALVPGSTMPGYKHLSETELQAMATFLASLK
jgi:quinol-cytochrome oxidoreductase complex cytochrome b subunit